MEITSVAQPTGTSDRRDGRRPSRERWQCRSSAGGCCPGPRPPHHDPCNILKVCAARKQAEASVCPVGRAQLTCGGSSERLGRCLRASGDREGWGFEQS